MTAPDVVVMELSRREFARLLEREESLPASSALDVGILGELRSALRLSAARRVGAALAASGPGGDTPCPGVSPGVDGPAGAVPFGDELTTDEAASLLGCNVRTVRRRCHGKDGDRPALLRYRADPVSGAFLVSSYDVELLRAGGGRA